MLTDKKLNKELFLKHNNFFNLTAVLGQMSNTEGLSVHSGYCNKEAFTPEKMDLISQYCNCKLLYINENAKSISKFKQNGSPLIPNKQTGYNIDVSGKLECIDSVKNNNINLVIVGFKDGLDTFYPLLVKKIKPIRLNVIEYSLTCHKNKYGKPIINFKVNEI